MPKIYIPAAHPDDWRQFLAEPEKQWKSGFSARTLAHCWQAANGLPAEVASLLRTCGDNPTLLLAIPEYKTPLPGSSRGESQNDVFALARAGDLTFAIMVEGKVHEPFGEKVGDWLRNASEGKRTRLNYICEQLDLALPLPNNIYYQLLHRSAAAVIEARRFKTDVAVMIVHSFSPEKLWFDAFSEFASLFQVNAVPDRLIPVRPKAQPPLYIGWATGNCNFLRA